MSSDLPVIESIVYRRVLGHFATGVTVVTGISPDGPNGLTIGSFTSVSLDPPLVGFLPQLSSESWPTIAPSGAFCVNVLGTDQHDHCWRFAKDAPAGGRFDGIGWSPAPTGSPLLDGAIAWIDCTVEATYEMGDHWFVLGRVVALGQQDEDQANEPLIFYRGQLGQFVL